MAITLGSACLDRAGSSGTTNTFVVKENPASEAGSINVINIWAKVDGGNMTGIDVASFTDEGSNVLSTNGVASNIGTATAGECTTFNAPGDFTAFAIASGEYLGVTYDAGRLEYDTGGSGVWDTTADDIPASSVTFGALLTDRDYSIGGTATEAGGLQKSIVGSMIMAGALSKKLMAKRTVQGAI